jgi:hypothetical protein
MARFGAKQQTPIATPYLFGASFLTRGPSGWVRSSSDSNPRTPREKGASKFATVSNDQVTEKITHLGEAAPHHTLYSGYSCKCVAGSRALLRPSGRRKKVKTARLNHLSAALLAAVAAGLLAAVGLVVVLYAQPAEANYPGQPGKIAYAGFDGDAEIYTINPDGGSNVKVTSNNTGNYEPAYSPNANKIAYSGFDGQDYEIYTVNPDGGGKTKLTDNNTDDDEPYYSPNGTKIAYTGRGTGGDKEIYTINTDGGGKFNVTDNTADDKYPSYSPSGKSIAYVYDPGNLDTEIYTINPDGGGKQRVTDNSTANFDPYWGSQGGGKGK